MLSLAALLPPALHLPEMGAAAPPTRSAAAPMLEPLVDRRSLVTLACLAPGLMMAPPALAAEVKLKNFPGSLSSDVVDEAVWKSLSARGYTKENTLFGMSVCSDEVNFFEKELIDLMKRRWGESFSLGGLAGVPFAGKAGLSAYAHHVPDEGKLFILFAPHVGVGLNGKVGALERDGIAETSSACGAAVGAYKTLKNKPGAAKSTMDDLADLQFDYIKYKLSSKLDGISNAQDDLAFVTYQMYQMVRDAMMEEIAAVPGIWDDCSELAVLGVTSLFEPVSPPIYPSYTRFAAKLAHQGIQINRFDGGDAFQPLMFQTTTKEGKTTNLYPSTFGDVPDLTGVLGSRPLSDRVVAATLGAYNAATLARLGA